MELIINFGKLTFYKLYNVTIFENLENTDKYVKIKNLLLSFNQVITVIKFFYVCIIIFYYVAIPLYFSPIIK